MTHTCKHYTSQDISRFFDNEVSPDQRELIEHHLVHCKRCRQVLEQYQSIATGFNVHVDQQVQTLHTAGMRHRLAATLTPLNKAPWARVSRFFNHHLYLKLASVAAIVLICLVPFKPVLFGPGGPSAIVKSVDTDFASVMIIETLKEKHTIIWFSET